MFLFNGFFVSFCEEHTVEIVLFQERGVRLEVVIGDGKSFQLILGTRKSTNKATVFLKPGFHMIVPIVSVVSK